MIEELKNPEFLQYYQYLCKKSNKYNNLYPKPNTKPKPYFGNLLLLYKINLLATKKNVPTKHFCKIINKNPNYFYYGLKNHGVTCNKTLLHKVLKYLYNI